MKTNLIFLVFAIFLFPLISSVTLTNTNIVSYGLNSSIYVDRLVLDKLQVTNVSIEFTNIISPCSISFLNFTDSNKSILISNIVNCSVSASNPSSSNEGIFYPTYSPTPENLQDGYEVQLQKNWQARFSFNNENHTIRLDNIINKTAILTISSNPITFNMSINETKKINLNGDNYYDLSVFLKNISDNVADFIIKSLHEVIPTESRGETPGTENSPKNFIQTPYIYTGIIVLVIMITLVIYFISERNKGKEEELNSSDKLVL